MYAPPPANWIKTSYRYLQAFMVPSAGGANFRHSSNSEEPK